MAKIIVHGKTLFDSNHDYMTIQDAMDYLERMNLKPKLNCPNCGAAVADKEEYKQLLKNEKKLKKQKDPQKITKQTTKF